MGDYQRNMGEAIGGIEEQFRQYTKTFAVQRTNILKDSSLSAQAREEALQKLHKVEISAMNDFAKKMEEVVGNFDKIPEIVGNNLRNKILQANIDVNIEAGAMDTKDLFAAQGSQISNSLQSFALTLDAAGQDLARVYEMQEPILKRNAEIEKSVADSMEKAGEMTGEFSDRLRDAIKTEKDKDGGMRISGTSKEKMAQLREEAKAIADSTKKAIDEKSQGMEPAIALLETIKKQKTRRESQV
jgi:hypothetical protein